MADQQQRMQLLKNGLTQYSGALLDSLLSSDFEGRPLAAGQQVASWLIEEALRIIQSEGRVSWFKAKPVFRGANHLLESRIRELNEMAVEADDAKSVIAFKEMAKRYRAVMDMMAKLTEINEEDETRQERSDAVG